MRSRSNSRIASPRQDIRPRFSPRRPYAGYKKRRNSSRRHTMSTRGGSVGTMRTLVRNCFLHFMKQQPLRTSVIGSYPFPGWLEFASRHLDQFGSADIAEMQDDAARVAIGDQLDAGLDV